MIRPALGTITDLPLRGTSQGPPPPSSAERSQAELRRRARKALRLLERKLWVTDDTGYRSRNTAKATARRLVDYLGRFEEVPSEHLEAVTRLRQDGWHWWLRLKP